MKIYGSDYESSVRIQIDLVSKNLPQVGEKNTLVLIQCFNEQGEEIPYEHIRTCISKKARGPKEVFKWLKDHIGNLTNIAHYGHNDCGKANSKEESTNNQNPIDHDEDGKPIYFCKP
jgi:hypothetical protein